MKTYCTECGQPTEYTNKQPKFCGKCGESFGSSVASVSSTSSTPSSPQKFDPKKHVRLAAREEPKTVIEEINGRKRLVKKVPYKSFRKEEEEPEEEYDENLVSDLFDKIDPNGLQVDASTLGNETFTVKDIACRGEIGFSRPHRKKAKKSKNATLKEFDKGCIPKKESITVG